MDTDSLDCQAPKKNLLVLTGLDLWSLGDGKGGPAFARTLEAYSKAGWALSVMTSAPPGPATNESTNARWRWIGRARTTSPRSKVTRFAARYIEWRKRQSEFIRTAHVLFPTSPPDVVYAYEIHGVRAARRLATSWGRPLVARFQGTILRSWQVKRCWRLRAWEHVIALSTPADLVIMTDDGTQGNQVLSELGVPAERVRFWRNGVDTNRPLPHSDSRLGGDTLHLLSVSRLVSWKRVDRAIEALADLSGVIPNVELMVVGDGPERDALEGLARARGISDRVTFVGSISQNEVSRFLRECDIFLSLYDLSNLGNPLMEAMSAGCCVVTIDNGDTNTLVKDGINGILLSEASLPQLPEVIARLWYDRPLRERLQKGAHETGKTFWSWNERMAAEIQEVGGLLGE